MNIYPSSKVLPYVYCCVHKITGKIYIGSRANKKQKLPSHLDFPNYKTSSGYVKPIFDEFDWHIVAEFFNNQDAYNFEQQLIHEQWQVSKEMSLNKRCYHGKKSWNVIGIKRNHSEDAKRKIGDFFRGKLRLEEHKHKMRKSHSKEHNRKVGDALRGKSKSEEHKHKLRKPLSEEIKRNRSIIFDVLTPDGFVIENTTMKELCSQFNFVYITLTKHFKNNKPYRGFTKINEYYITN